MPEAHLCPCQSAAQVDETKLCFYLFFIPGLCQGCREAENTFVLFLFYTVTLEPEQQKRHNELRMTLVTVLLGFEQRIRCVGYNHTVELCARMHLLNLNRFCQLLFRCEWNLLRRLWLSVTWHLHSFCNWQECRIYLIHHKSCLHLTWCQYGFTNDLLYIDITLTFDPWPCRTSAFSL